MDQILLQLKPIPMKERLSILFVNYGRLDVIDGDFVLVDKNGVQTHIPVGSGFVSFLQKEGEKSDCCLDGNERK